MRKFTAVNGTAKQAMRRKEAPRMLVSASGMAGYSDSNRIQTRKITDHFYLCGDGIAQTGPGYGLMAPRVALCAAHEANCIAQYICTTKGEEP